MAKIDIYTTDTCPFCNLAKQFFKRKGVTFNEIRVDNDPKLRQQMVEKSQQRTVPQIFINEQAIGGYTDLVQLDKENRLDNMLV